MSYDIFHELIGDDLQTVEESEYDLCTIDGIIYGYISGTVMVTGYCSPSTLYCKYDGHPEAVEYVVISVTVEFGDNIGIQSIGCSYDYSEYNDDVYDNVNIEARMQNGLINFDRIKHLI